jgi:non-reducing end alpha-L-arabinofuranosidase
VLLGTGGDNSNSSWGTFYEGAITAGQPSDATDQGVAANIAAVGHGK